MDVCISISIIHIYFVVYLDFKQEVSRGTEDDMVIPRKMNVNYSLAILLSMAWELPYPVLYLYHPFKVQSSSRPPASMSPGPVLCTPFSCCLVITVHRRAFSGWSISFSTYEGGMNGLTQFRAQWATGTYKPEPGALLSQALSIWIFLWPPLHASLWFLLSHRSLPKPPSLHAQGRAHVHTHICPQIPLLVPVETGEGDFALMSITVSNVSVFPWSQQSRYFVWGGEAQVGTLTQWPNGVET